MEKFNYMTLKGIVEEPAKKDTPPWLDKRCKLSNIFCYDKFIKIIQRINTEIRVEGEDHVIVIKISNIY